MNKIDRMLGGCDNKLRLGPLMGEIPSPKYLKKESRFLREDENELKEKNKSKMFSNFITEWSTMGRVRRPYVSDLLIICIQCDEIEAANYIYRHVMKERGDINGDNKEDILARFTEDKWGEGLNNEYEGFNPKDFRFETNVQNNLLKNVSFNSLRGITYNFHPRYTICKEGASADVYWARIHNGTKIAIKKLKLSYNMLSDMKAMEKSLQREIEYLPKLRHPNIIQLFGYSKTDTQCCLIYPKIKNGTLRHRMTSDNLPLSANQRLKIMMGMARGINHIHVHHLKWVKITNYYIQML